MMNLREIKISINITPILKALLILSFVASSTIWAQEIISKEKGFSGYIRLSYGYLNIRTNSIARFLNNELSHNPIASLSESPTRKSLGIFTFPFELRYTFVPEFTQVFIGNDLEDLLRFDVSQQLGIKQRINKVGIIKVALLYSAVPTKVWEDPFVINICSRLRLSVSYIQYYAVIRSWMWATAGPVSCASTTIGSASAPKRTTFERISASSEGSIAGVNTPPVSVAI